MSENIPDNWIERLKANNEQQLKVIYDENFPKIKKYVLENSGTIADAMDIYQDAFIAVWRNIQLDRVVFKSNHNLENYLFQVARNKWLDHLRSKKRKKTDLVDTMSLGDIISTPLEKEEEDYLKKVKAGFISLGNPCQELLHRFYFLKQRLSEIAATFSWTEATAKNNKYRCLQRLRNIVLSTKKNNL